MSSKKLPWGMVLFSLPFAGVGLGLLILSIIPTLYEWQTMSRWQSTPASVTQAELKVSHGDDSTSYQATATYSYTINGRTYTNSRVGINSGYDNIGSWQKDKSAALKRHRRNKDLIIVYVNPNDPQDSIIYPELRIGLFIFKIIFALIFGGVGFGLLFFNLRKNTRTDPQQLTSNKPWEADKDWQNPIKSNAQLGIWVAWGFTIFWNLISFPIAISAIPTELAKNNYPALLILLFPLVGLFLFRWALKSTAAWRHFGPTPLWLEPTPVLLAGTLAALLNATKN